MSMYSNQLQPALQNLLQRVVWFLHRRSSCPTYISADVCGGRKSLKASDAAEYIELFGSFSQDRHAQRHIYRRTLRE